jgi:hypothetical protein
VIIQGNEALNIQGHVEIVFLEKSEENRSRQSQTTKTRRHVLACSVSMVQLSLKFFLIFFITMFSTAAFLVFAGKEA